MAELHKTQSILLLTAHFSDSSHQTVKPLTISEWKRFADWLLKRDLHPWDLMTGDVGSYLREWSDKSISIERIQRLLDRRTALALAKEKWDSAGIWVLTREDFPKKFKKRLGTAAPIFVFGCGDRAQFRDGGLAVLGSRNAKDEDLAYSSGIGVMAAGNGLTVVSGGAKGVDESAMLGALSNNGTVVGVLAHDLLRTSSSVKYRKYIMEQQLVLISTANPNAGFDVGQAMERNKYIYCLSDAAFVVHSGKKGGTWKGALENLEKNWVLLWVKRTTDRNAGNAAIVCKGGQWVHSNINGDSLNKLISISHSVTKPEENVGRTAIAESEGNGTKYQPYQSSEPDKSASQMAKPESDLDESDEESNTGMGSKTSAEGFYDFFLTKLEVLCKDDAMTPVELASELDIKISQLNTWLKQAVKEGKLKKEHRPKVRYIWDPQVKANYTDKTTDKT